MWPHLGDEARTGNLGLFLRTIGITLLRVPVRKR